MKKNLLIIFLLSTISVFAQKEFNVWYFGSGVGLDFNAGAPVVLNNGSINTFEGCASTADANGALLFYTDGLTVWNRNHLAMPNGLGLLGNSSSSQSANIAPVVGSPGQYYIFTTPASGFPGFFYYSIVDMSLQAGMGDITALNVPLLDSVVEGNTIVPHANGTDYWAVTHKFGTADYYSYLINSSGINAPVVSTTGSFIASGIYDLIGYIKPSPCGNRIVYANTGGNFFDLSNFDNSTGILSNTITLPSTAGAAVGCYGTEFSPDGSRLYGAVNGNGDIWQFDLTAGSTAAIIASRTRVGICSGNNAGALQVAPDDKIYVGRYGFNYLGVINNPNALGVACNYADSGLSLGGLTTNWGLPGFYGNIWCNLTPVALFNAPHHICPGTCTNFTNLSLNGVSYLWTFNGATPSTSTDANPASVCYNTPGNYSVSLITYGASTSDTLTLNNYITVYPYPAPQGIAQNGDTLFANAGAVSYQWYHTGVLIPGATDYFYVATGSGDFNVVATDANGCEVEAAIFDVVASVQSAVGSMEGIVIHPNPVADKLVVSGSLMAGGDVSIAIFNILGEKVLAVSPLSLGRGLGGEVDVHALPLGNYWLEVTAGEKFFRSKFVKQ